MAGAASARNGWRAASFAAGIGLIAVALMPPLTGWAHHDLRGHMAQHVLLGMLAPLGLVLAAPGTAVLRRLPVAAARRLVALLDTPPVRVVIHPVTAMLLDIGGMYLLYLTPLYAMSLHDPVLHVLVHVHFVVAGTVFTWSIVGLDPAPRRPGTGTRLAVLFVAIAAHAVLGKIMYGYGFPRGAGHDQAEIRAAAQWMYYGGDVATLLLTIAFFAEWFGVRRRRFRAAYR